ncbi:hypothetical protein [Chroococcidiopsis sp. SAG 2025]|nr:hypothetical protein [Chroococcidiopsis sp. SAG 2025]
MLLKFEFDEPPQAPSNWDLGWKDAMAKIKWECRALSHERAD